MIDRTTIGKGLAFSEFLRFPLSMLEIFSDGRFLPFPEFYFYDQKNPDIKFVLDEVLFDTGNELDYLVMVSGHYKGFKQYFRKTDENFQCRLNDIVSKDEYSFRFNQEIGFKSKIGFRTTFHSNWNMTINIGIKSIMQFLSILYPSDSKVGSHTYYCIGKGRWI